MKKSKLQTPHIKREVIRRLAIGESQSSIAKDIGVNRSQINRFAGREDVKSFLELELMRLLEAVPDAVENIKKLVTEMKDIPKKDIKRLELAYKACLDTLKAGGIMPSPLQSQVITNIYHGEIHTIHPVVEMIVDKYSESLMSFDEDEEGLSQNATDTGK